MSTPALYDTLRSFKDIHKVVLGLAEDLTDEQINWKPEGYSTSIGFHLWHLARESDYLKAAILYHNPQFIPEFGDGKEIWEKDGLARKWGFPDELHQTVGTGMSDEAAATLPIPAKEDLLGYLRSVYEEIEWFIELLDTKYSTYENIDEELREKIEMVRRNLLVFLSHDCRHLGMMECLKGLQTGFGSATEKRKWDHILMQLAEIAFFSEDVPRMTDFYRRLLSVEPVASSDTMAIFFAGETKIFIHYKYAPKNGELPPENHHAFRVEDVDSVCKELVGQGLMLEIPPQDFYWGRSAYLRDPDGHQIELTQMEK